MYKKFSAVSFGSNQYTSLTNQQIAIYAGQKSGTTESLSQGLTCWYSNLPKGYEEHCNRVRSQNTADCIIEIWTTSFQKIKVISRVPRVLQEMWSRDHRHQISFLTLSRFEWTSTSSEIIRTLCFSNDFGEIEINFLKVKKVCWKVRLSTKMFTTLNIFRQEPSS